MIKEIIYHCKESKQGTPYATLVINYDIEKDICTFGASVCHHKDSYLKKLGASIARERINEGKSLVLSGLLCYYPKAVLYSLHAYLSDTLNTRLTDLGEQAIDYLVHMILAPEMDYWKEFKKLELLKKE